MSKKEVKKEKKDKLIITKDRADGGKDVIITKSPQKTVFGKIVIATLAILLGGTAIIGLIVALAQL